MSGFILEEDVSVIFAPLVNKQEGFLRCQTPTSTVRLKVEGCKVKNGECRIKSEE